MATNRISAKDGSGKQYMTRDGIRTAEEATKDLLGSSWAKIRFLEEVFAVAHNGGEGFVLPGYSSEGLAAILKDISREVFTIYAYHIGDNKEPGKTGEVPGWYKKKIAEEE